MPQTVWTIPVSGALSCPKPISLLTAAARVRVRELTFSQLMPTDKIARAVVLSLPHREFRSPIGQFGMGKLRAELFVHRAAAGAEPHRAVLKQQRVRLAYLLDVAEAIFQDPHRLLLSLLPSPTITVSRVAVATLSFTRRASAFARALGISRRDARLVLSTRNAEALIARLLFSFRHRLARIETLPCRGREHSHTPLRSARTLNAPPHSLLVYASPKGGRNLGMRYTLTA
ncbi:hypothetical protein [Streptomyces albus]|uniref:hypothetical protein n=1 Tax=Streptomyces albus TaxID=1888 RepID=UPI003456F6AA